MDGMAYPLVACEGEQGDLMVPFLQTCMPQGNLAWFNLDLEDQMDLRKFCGAHREDGWGTAAYDQG